MKGFDINNKINFCFFFQAEDGIRDYDVTEFRRVLFRSSDLDLHLVVDFNKVDENRELVYDYFRVAKSVWNSSHEIDICGHEVEIYVQDSEEPHHSTGVYSLEHNEGVTKHTKNTSTMPKESTVRQKAQNLIDGFDKISQDQKDVTDVQADAQRQE